MGSVRGRPEESVRSESHIRPPLVISVRANPPEGWVGPKNLEISRKPRALPIGARLASSFPPPSRTVKTTPRAVPAARSMDRSPETCDTLGRCQVARPDVARRPRPKGANRAGPPRPGPRSLRWRKPFGWGRMGSRSAGSARPSWARGIHDPKAWGSAFQVPRLLSDAIGTLPRLAPDGDGDVARRRLPEAPLPDARRPGGRDGADPPAQAGGGQRLPLVAGRLRDGLRLLRDGPDDRPAQPRGLGDPRPVDPGARPGPLARAGGSPGSCSWGWASRS